MQDTILSKRIHPDGRYAVIDDELTGRGCSIYSKEGDYIETQDQTYLQKQGFILQN